jgi:hypothetical protein
MALQGTSIVLGHAQRKHSSLNSDIEPLLSTTEGRRTLDKQWLQPRGL